jgi:hypothetical protein
MNTFPPDKSTSRKPISVAQPVIVNTPCINPAQEAAKNTVATFLNDDSIALIKAVLIPRTPLSRIPVIIAMNIEIDPTKNSETLTGSPSR